MTNQHPYQQPYPQNYGAPAPVPRKRPKKWPWIAAAAIAGMFVIGSIAGPSENAPATPKQNTATPVVASSPATPKAPTSTVKPAKVDPLRTDGTWLVGTEVKPGTYRTALAAGAYGSGYYEVCADADCKIGKGLLENGSGGDIVVIPADAYSVKFRGLVVTPIG